MRMRVLRPADAVFCLLISYSHPRMRRGIVFSRVCLCVCVYPVRLSNFESLDVEASFLYADTYSEYLGKVKGQGHSSKKRN